MKSSLVAALPLLVLGVGCGAGRPATGSALPRGDAGAPQPFQSNVLALARSNDAYRHVLFTGARSQLVLMTLPPGGEIGLESHAHVEQLIFVASGHGKAVMNGAETPVGEGDVVIATPDASHNIVNTGTEPLRLYTVYAPPNHIDARLHPARADAQRDAADEAFGAAVR